MTLPTDAALADNLDAALPQTQCTRCGYPRCRAYADALARGEANINQCPPGGEETIRALANILGVAPQPPDPTFGVRTPRRRAAIDESRCIGCRKCLDACPVDAIVGAEKCMHTVIAERCSGCELCLPPCPVDCIDMVPAPPVPAARARHWPDYADEEVQHWRARAQARLERPARRDGKRAARRADKRRLAVNDVPPREQMRAEIRAAIERVKHKRRDSRTTR